MILKIEMSKLRYSLNGLKNAVEDKIEIKYDGDKANVWLNAFNTKTRLYIKSRLDTSETITPNSGDSTIIDSKIISIVNASDHTGIVELKIKDKEVLMTIGKSKFKLPIIIGTFPIIDMETTDKDAIDISILDLKEIDKATGTFASTDRNRLILMATNISGGYATATDTSVLSRKKLDNLKENISINVPQSSFKAILDTFDNFTSIYVANNRMLVKRDDREMAFSLIEGQYPAVDKLVAPQNAKETIKFDRDHLTKKLNMLKLFTSKDNAAVNLVVSKNEIKSKIAGQEISIDCESTWENSVGLNLDKFIKIVSKTTSDNVELKIQSNEKPLYIVEGNLTMLLLPYKV